MEADKKQLDEMCEIADVYLDDAAQDESLAAKQQLLRAYEMNLKLMETEAQKSAESEKMKEGTKQNILRLQKEISEIR